MLGILWSRRARRAAPFLLLLGLGTVAVVKQLQNTAGSDGGAAASPAPVKIRRDALVLPPVEAVKAKTTPPPQQPRTTAKRAAAAVQTTPFVPARPLSTELHPAYKTLIRSYPYQPVRGNDGQFVNIILVRSAPGERDIALYNKYKDELLFIGISSFEDFPLASVNPFSAKYAPDKYVGMFPGFLHMMREPEKYFPPHVKLLLMSQSDFSLPSAPPHDYAVPRKWDFTYSGSDQVSPLPLALPVLGAQVDRKFRLHLMSPPTSSWTLHTRIACLTQPRGSDFYHSILHRTQQLNAHNTNMVTPDRITLFVLTAPEHSAPKSSSGPVSLATFRPKSLPCLSQHVRLISKSLL